MMRKLTALTCVLGWSAFWVFGFLALSSDMSSTQHAVVASLVAGLGMLTGAFSYIRLCREMPVNYQRVFPHP